MLRYVDKLPSLNVPSYYSLDLAHWLESAATGAAFVRRKDWFNSRHIEFVPDFINTLPTEVRRTWLRKRCVDLLADDQWISRLTIAPRVKRG